MKWDEWKEMYGRNECAEMKFNEIAEHEIDLAWNEENEINEIKWMKWEEWNE